MKILKAYKYKIYPYHDQKSYLVNCFGASRFVWNKLVHNFNSWTHDGPNRVLHSKILKDTEEFSFLNEVPAVVIQQKENDFNEMRKQYFSKNRKKKLGKPKFKRRGGHESIRFPASTTVVKSFDSIKAGKLKLPKLKTPIKIKTHREFDGRPISLTVSKTPSGDYFVSILVEEDVKLKPMTGNEVGIDLGLTDLIITPDGYKFKRISKRLEKTNLSLKRSQRKLARKTIGSKNYEKKRIECAKKYAKITRIRNDHYHNVSNYLVSNYDAIYTEDLNVNGMMKNRKLARVIQEASWSTLVGMIAYKANWSGKTFHKIDRFVPSSKTCSHCGHKIENCL